MEYRKACAVLFVLFACLVIFTACGGGKYADVKQVLSQYVGLNETLYKELDSAKDGNAVAAAIKSYVAKAKELVPTMQKLSEKYPELNDNPPQELKEIVEKMEKSNESMSGMFDKLSVYANDAAVIEAIGELQNM